MQTKKLIISTVMVSKMWQTFRWCDVLHSRSRKWL